VKRVTLLSILSAAVVISLPAFSQVTSCGLDPVGECKDGCVQSYEVAYDACSQAYNNITDPSERAYQQRLCYEREFKNLLGCNKDCEGLFGGSADDRLGIMIRPISEIVAGATAVQGA
jgi:hypothetical protein